MRSFLLFVLSALFTLPSMAAEGDTLRVQAHDEVHWNWYGNFRDTVQFPESGSYRKILMNYTMGCPQNGCSPWDYTTKIEVYIPINDSTTETIELGRVMTPYNGNKSYGWFHTWVYDVTDYAPILKGEKVLNAHYSGYSDGFTISVDFEFIEGTPPRDPISVQEIYGGSFPYGYANDPIENYCVPTDVTIDANAEEAMFRMVASGHGFNGNGFDPGNPDNCAEFCDKWFKVLVNNDQVAQHQVWRDDCGSNTLEGQTGTWIYNRAGWCPGDRALIFDDEISSKITPGQTATIDVNWQNYTYTSGSSFGISYIVEGTLFQYGPKNHNLDVALERIIAPSDDDEFLNVNPICNNGQVEIRNVGAEDIKSVRIDFWVEGGIEKKSASWQGTLKFNQTAIINLNSSDFKLFGGMTDNIFHAEVAVVNGGSDDYSANDHIQARFNAPTMIPESIIVQLQTNNAASEFSYEIRNDKGAVVFAKNGLSNSTQYTDTVTMAEGCYTMHLIDTDCDGLRFFANNDGSGSILIRENSFDFVPIHIFNPEFGCESQFAFTVGYPLGSTERKEMSSIDMQLYPNPSDGNTTVQITGRIGAADLFIYNAAGRLVQQLNNVGWNTNISDLSAGVYFVKLVSDNAQQTKKLIVH